MSYQVVNFAAVYRGNQNRIDPRVAIARHLEWSKNTGYGLPTPWRVPEPDNYNHAIRTTHPVACDFIKDAVFYRDLTTNKWWNVFYVPTAQDTDFRAWVEQQDLDIYWFHTKAPAIREERRRLYNAANGEINTDERLFQMGYYADLSSKYFSDDDKKLLELMGPVRNRVLGLEEV